MTALQSDSNKYQNELLAAYAAARENAKGSIEAWAHAYKACIDDGIDMCRKENAEMGARLLMIASGKLAPMAQLRLIALSSTSVQRLAALSKPLQKKLLDDGAEVLRDGKTLVVPYEHLSPGEARRLIDVTGGEGRIVGPDEQKCRLAPVAPKHDQIVAVRLAYDERVALGAIAHKRGMRPDTLIKAILREQGLLE